MLKPNLHFSVILVFCYFATFKFRPVQTSVSLNITLSMAKVQCSMSSNAVGSETLGRLMHTPMPRCTYFEVKVEKLGTGPIGGLQIIDKAPVISAVEESFGWARILQSGDRILSVNGEKIKNAQLFFDIATKENVFNIIIERKWAPVASVETESDFEVGSLELTNGDGTQSSEHSLKRVSDGKSENDLGESAQFALLPEDIKRIMRQKLKNIEQDLASYKPNEEDRQNVVRNPSVAVLNNEVKKVPIANDVPEWKRLRCAPK